MAPETAAPQEEAPAVETQPEDKRGRSRASLVGLLERLGRWTVALLARPRVRTVLVGLVLIIIGAFFIQHSVWTFPIVIVGILMVVVAWVGGRLEGRFAVEWSEAGTGFEMRARFKSATPLLTPPLPAPPPSVTTTTVTSTRPRPEAEITDADTVEDDTVIEGEAHTVEIDVEELRALVAAAEQLARESSSSKDTPTTTDVPVSWQENRAA
jgi:hypothetical protein